MTQALHQDISTSRSSSSRPVISSAQLELTYPYHCGQRIAAEFDVRVTVGLEDNELLLGEIDLFGYDDKHHGAYESCTDISLCNKIRSYVESSNIESARALELLRRKDNYETLSVQARPSHRRKQGFANFVGSYAECLAPGLD